MFREEEHPRDTYGKFTDKNDIDKPKTYRQNTDYNDIIKESGITPKICGK